MSPRARRLRVALVLTSLLLPAVLFAKDRVLRTPARSSLALAAGSFSSLIRHLAVIFGGSGSRIDPNGTPAVPPPTTTTSTTDQGDSGSRLDPNG